jgi:hypothetical protein
MFGIVGNNSTAVDGTLTLASGPFAITRQGSISQTAWGVGDLYPVASMRWNNGVNNWMVYGTGDIPVGGAASSAAAVLARTAAWE